VVAVFYEIIKKYIYFYHKHFIHKISHTIKRHIFFKKNIIFQIE